MNFKKLTSITIITIVFASMFVSPASAELNRLKPTPSSDNPDTKNRMVAGVSICENLKTFESKLLARVTERENNRAKLKNDRENKLGDTRSERNEKLDSKRETNDTRRDDIYENLDELANTPEKKAAVEEFQSTVEKAVETRRIAIDTAIKTFRGSVDKSVSDRDVAVNAAIAKYKKAVETAFDKAGTSCDNETSALTIRSTLKTELQKASDTLKKDIAAIDKARANIQELNDARKTAIQKAVSDFKLTMEKAKADLKLVLKPENEN